MVLVWLLDEPWWPSWKTSNNLTARLKYLRSCDPIWEGWKELPENEYILSPIERRTAAERAGLENPEASVLEPRETLRNTV